MMNGSNSSQEGTGVRALIVDDQRTMRRIVRALLKQISIDDVVEADNGQSALKIVEGNPEKVPDVVICDLHMDHMDGLEFCNKLRLSKSEILRQIPIILLTGDNDEFMLSVSKQVGVQAILKKPIGADELRDAISSAVGFQV